MQINRISIYPNLVSRVNTKNNNIIPFKGNSNKEDEEVKKVEPQYPRRYLPSHYPNPILPSKKEKVESYDSFTGLRDKNTLLAAIQERINTKSPISIGMFDMDNFKSVNELLGYKTGDNFIKETSNIIGEVAEKYNQKAYRFGGEEFVVLLGDPLKEDEHEGLVNEVVERVNSSPYIASYKGKYLESANSRLSKLYKEHNKVKDLVPLRAKKEVLEDLESHSSNIKRDSYFKQVKQNTNINLYKLYFAVIEEIPNTVELDTEDELDSYLLNKYSKSFEIAQTEKWVHDFKKNNGFSITGVAKTFSSKEVEGKTPIDIINIAGEALKEAKEVKKS